MTSPAPSSPTNCPKKVISSNICPPLDSCISVYEALIGRFTYDVSISVRIGRRRKPLVHETLMYFGKTQVCQGADFIANYMDIYKHKALIYFIGAVSYTNCCVCYLVSPHQLLQHFESPWYCRVRTIWARVSRAVKRVQGGQRHFRIRPGTRSSRRSTCEPSSRTWRRPFLRSRALPAETTQNKTMQLYINKLITVYERSQISWCFCLPLNAKQKHV